MTSLIVIFVVTTTTVAAAAIYNLEEISTIWEQVTEFFKSLAVFQKDVTHYN